MPTLQINDKFANRYLLKKLLGVGGYSQVWLATDAKSGNLEIAVKIFAPGQGMDDKGLELFSKEYSLVFNLNHPGLLKPTYFDDFEGSPYLVMQYCNQGSVFGKIGEISEKEIARFMQQAASSLMYLHNQDPSIIHQDIKPDNFLIDSQGNYLLADFGISSKILRTLTKSMGANASTGTLAYMPPEKFSADKQIVKAGDIFSLGVTIYELLTGDLPFGDNGGLTLKAGAEVPNLPGNFNPELNRLLIRCMAKEPWDRPTAEQLEETATKFLQTGRWSSVGKYAPETIQEPHKEHEQPRASRKTETIQQQQPDPQPQIKSQTDPDKKKNFIPEIILVVVVFLIVVAFIWPKGPSAHDLEITRLANSIRITDSIDMVQAEQQRRMEITTGMRSNNLKIGAAHAGGLIFFLDGTGEHGKVCAAEDQSLNATWTTAKLICNNLNLNGYDDWYLPSIDELSQMNAKLYKKGIGDISKYRYWSSTEYQATDAWYYAFNSDFKFNYPKHFLCYVRAVRAF